MGIKSFVKSIGCTVNLYIPKKINKILFESNSDYCDNTRAVYDYMIRNGFQEKYHFVWCVKNPDKFNCDKMENVTITSFHSSKWFLPYLYHIFTSKTVMYTHFVPPFVNPKAQTVVNLWHGTPLKSIKGHVHPSTLFTYLISPSEWCDDIIADSFEMSKDKLLRSGYPRNDILFDEIDCITALGIDKSSFKKTVLWMPTFRRPVGGAYQDAEVTSTGLPLLTNIDELTELNEELHKVNVLLIIKLHPGQDLSGVSLINLSNIKTLTNKALDEMSIQLYHLVADSDVLLTDYSSIYFDYLLLNRPIGFIIDDIEEYNKKRGFVTDEPLSYMPGEKIKTVEELYSFFEDISNGKDDYVNDRARVNKIVNQFNDNKSAERLLKLLKISK